MDEPFEIPVLYNGKESLFPATLQVQGYTHKFVVLVNGVEVLFEPDEEQLYRAVVNGELLTKTLDASLLKEIAKSIEALLK